MSQAKPSDTDDDRPSNSGQGSIMQLSGDIVLSESTEYEIDHRTYEGVPVVEITLHGAETLEISFTLRPEQAEEFVTRVRDEIVRGKRSELEWLTNTDPESGVAGED